MEGQFLPVQRSNKKKITLLITLGIIVVAVLVALYFADNFSSSRSSINREEVLNVLIGKSELYFPPIVSVSNMPVGSLPEYGKNLILPNSGNISAGRATFGNNKQGYVIEYVTRGNIVDFHRAFLLMSYGNDWKPQKASRTSEVSFIDFKGSGSQGRITMTTDGSEVNVKITAIDL